MFPKIKKNYDGPISLAYVKFGIYELTSFFFNARVTKTIVYPKIKKNYDGPISLAIAKFGIYELTSFFFLMLERLKQFCIQKLRKIMMIQYQ